MFASRRLISCTLRATHVSLARQPASFTYSVIPSINVLAATKRGYATRRGASSRPVQVKERPAEDQTNTQVSQRVDEQPLGDTQQQNTNAQSYEQYYGTQASDIVNSSVSLQAFLKRSMVTTGVGIGGAAVACVGFMQLPFVSAHPYITLGVGFVATIGGLLGMQAVRPTYVQEGEIVRAIDPPGRTALYGAFVVGEGLVLAPMLKMVAVMAPMAIPVAASLALGTMAGMVAYALKQPQGSLAKWGPALYVGVLGLIAAGIVNMFVHSSALAFATSAISVGIFAAFTAYDTHEAINSHNAGQPDHLLVAANFFLNFINLFLDYLRLIRGFFEE